VWRNTLQHEWSDSLPWLQQRHQLHQQPGVYLDRPEPTGGRQLVPGTRDAGHQAGAAQRVPLGCA